MRCLTPGHAGFSSRPPSVRACHCSLQGRKSWEDFCLRAKSATALTPSPESAVRNLSPIQLLADLLPERVGSRLSLNALREDLDASHRALTHWMDILERLYYVVRLRPYGSSRVPSLRKMPKAYLWDWSEVPAPGPRRFCRGSSDARFRGGRLPAFAKRDLPPFRSAQPGSRRKR